MTRLTLVLAALVAAPAAAQSAQVAYLDATSLMPVATATVATTCGLPKFIEPPTIINPTAGYFDDPAVPALDCTVPMDVTLLPDGIYRAAFALDGDFSAPTSAFLVVAAQPAPHPCDEDPTEPATVEVGEVFIVWACHDQRDVNGLPISSLSGWRLYRDGVRIFGAPAEVETTPNAEGLIFAGYARVEDAPGRVTYGLTLVSDVGEGAPFEVVVEVQDPPPPPEGLPAAPVKGGVQ